ncbi:hypothetical protein [Streptomyces sp. x-80]|uniref:hypothetical protein n=1 Tax=Streptomyces sp. x-80 TaxID=2789282 RepID=UPI00397F5CEC
MTVTAPRARRDGVRPVPRRGAHPHPGQPAAAGRLVPHAGCRPRYPLVNHARVDRRTLTGAASPARPRVPRAPPHEAPRTARREGADTAHRTCRRDRHGDAGESLPGYWDDSVSHIGTGVSE